MGRWTQYDEDEHRLPDGLERVGYDADTQTYHYKDSNGGLFKGEPGARYGVIRPASPGTFHLGDPQISNEEADNIARWAEDGPRSPYRYLMLWFLIIGVTLLLVIKFMYWQSHDVTCGEGQRVYQVASGDTCWKIATDAGMSLAELMELNLRLDCDSLQLGQGICVPKK